MVKKDEIARIIRELDCGTLMPTHEDLIVAYQILKLLVKSREELIKARRRYLYENWKKINKSWSIESVTEEVDWFLSQGLIQSEFPKIVCLCGSTRFTPLMMMMEWEYAKQGILTLGWFVKPTRTDEPTDHLAEHEGLEKVFDELHKRKIDLADEVLILNVGGYIGDSTRSEIAYAKSKNKPVRYLEPLT